MNQQGPKATIVSLFFVAGLAAYGVAQQRAGKCPPDVVDLKAPAYRIGLAAHGTKKNCELFLYISVEPHHFFREDMLALAERLNNDFCYERQLTVIFLDDYYAARHPIRNTKTYWDAERGIYHLDRNTGRAYIKFSTSRDKPKDEVVIELDSRGK